MKTAVNDKPYKNTISNPSLPYLVSNQFVNSPKVIRPGPHSFAHYPLKSRFAFVLLIQQIYFWWSDIRRDAIEA